MTDAHTQQRQQWLQGLQKPVAKCLQRNADGSQVFKYTPAAEMQPDYLARKFASLQRQAEAAEYSVF